MLFNAKPLLFITQLHFELRSSKLKAGEKNKNKKKTHVFLREMCNMTCFMCNALQLAINTTTLGLAL